MGLLGVQFCRTEVKSMFKNTTAVKLWNDLSQLVHEINSAFRSIIKKMFINWRRLKEQVYTFSYLLDL